MQTAIMKEYPVAEADHLVTIPGSDWAFWRCVCLRSAGFPAEGILKLVAPPELIQAADELATALRIVEVSRKEAVQQVNAALDVVRANGQWADKKIRNPLLDARTKLNIMKVPQPAPVVVAEFIARFEQGLQQVARKQAEFDQTYSKLIELVSQSIGEIAGSPDFREAVTWQNPEAVKTALNTLLRRQANGVPRSRTKQSEELVASYWQRYCMKNDTIGFFGPVGWAHYDPEVQYLDLKTREPLVTARKTYLEAWAVAALGTAITQKYDVQRWIAPILMPFVRVGTTVLHHPVFGPIRITSKQAAVLRACDGRDTASQLAGRLVRSFPKQFLNEQEVYATLAELAKKRFVYWNFNIPAGPYPERTLRLALERIEDPQIRQEAIGLLDEFESARSKIARAAGDADSLAAAFENLERMFVQITHMPASQNHGQVYAGRTPVYEDCRRNVEVLLGPELFRSFSEPLSLLLRASRWLTTEVGQAYRRELLRAYDEVVRATGTPSVDAAVLWGKTLPLFFERSAELTGPVHEEFHSKWSRILQLDHGHAPVHYSYDQLRQKVFDEFPASKPGWIAARYSSPDIMIAATGADAVRRGDYLFVLGEVHVSKNTLDASLFVNQHPSPDDLLRSVEYDLRGFNVLPVGQKLTLTASRVTPSLVPHSFLRLEYLQDAFTADRSRALPMSTLVIEHKNGELMARSRSGDFHINWVDLMGGLLSLSVIDIFKIVSPRPHSPRISIDRLVIKREAWRFPPSEIPFAQHSSPSQRFLEARMWAQVHGVPRFVFYKVPVESKPAYLDFDSPVLVDIFCKMVRRTIHENPPDASIDLSEMLPTPDQLWLTDAHGRRYTSEFRFVAVDQAS